MSISSISSDAYWPWYTVSALPATGDSSETGDATTAMLPQTSASSPYATAANPMSQALAQTMTQLGLAPPEDPQQATYALMHDVYQAAGSAMDGYSATSLYSDMATSLQGLAASVSFDPDSPTSTQLTSDFQNLMESLGNTDASVSTSTDPTLTLQNFLQTLASNLNTESYGNYGMPALGGLIDTTA